jgi:hypothetical protein
MHTFLKGLGKIVLSELCHQKLVGLIGLAMRVEEFKPITNAALLILAAEKSLEITSELSVLTIKSPQVCNSDKFLLRYGQKLSMVFSGENVVSIYRMLGLKSL